MGLWDEHGLSLRLSDGCDAHTILTMFGHLDGGEDEGYVVRVDGGEYQVLGWVIDGDGELNIHLAYWDNENGQPFGQPFLAKFGDINELVIY